MSSRRVLDPATVRAAALVEVDLGPDVFVRARRADLTQLLFEGLIPQPLTQAAIRLTASRGLAADVRLDDEGDEGDKAAQLDTLRRYAMLVVVEPPIVAVEDGVPGHLAVTFLTLAQLLMIWNATVTLPRVGAVQADTFRPGARPDVAPVLLPRQSVRPAAEPVVGVAAFRSA